jgi:hypothetical protein
MSLIGKKPSDTYKSLLKVGEDNNQILDTTLRPIEDGLGNDSALSLSTTSVRALKLEVDDVVINSNSISNASMDGGTY